MLNEVGGVDVATVRPSDANAIGSETLTAEPPADASRRSQALVVSVCCTSTRTGALAGLSEPRHLAFTAVTR